MLKDKVDWSEVLESLADGNDEIEEDDEETEES
jgi:hypothetical protein